MLAEAFKYRLDKIERWLRSTACSAGYPLCVNDRKLLDLRDRHRGASCFVVGNGPSLTMADLTKMHQLGCMSFAFNKIFLSYDQTPYRPTYYMVEDDLVLTSIRADLSVVVNSPSRILVPRHYAEKLPAETRLATTYYWLTYHTDYLPHRPRVTAWPLHFFWGATVTFSALQMAMYMGFNPIYLIGQDFSYGDPVPTRDNSDVVYATGKGHFDPRYYRPGDKHHAPKKEHQLKAFEAIELFARDHGITIYNATRGGELEVFPRIALDDVLSSTPLRDDAP